MAEPIAAEFPDPNSEEERRRQAETERKRAWRAKQGTGTPGEKKPPRQPPGARQVHPLRKDATAVLGKVFMGRYPDLVADGTTKMLIPGLGLCAMAVMDKHLNLDKWQEEAALIEMMLALAIAEVKRRAYEEHLKKNGQAPPPVNNEPTPKPA